ncbi:MAG: hypothetical protein KF906_02080 [Actinobacteria bacterium]|nr:hypothetical protein [Actinomycetota bacterium]
MNPRTRLAASVGLAVIASLCLSFIATATLVRRKVLDADTYTSALADADAYDRVYTEVLTDPAFTEAVADLLGRLEVDPALAPDAAATMTNALRWALPPHRVESGTDALIGSTVDYIRGDTDAFHPTVRMSDALDAVDAAAVTYTSTLIARAEVVEAGSMDDYRAEVDRFVARLRDGRIPGRVPVLAQSVEDRDGAIDVILDAVGRSGDDAARSTVAATIESGDDGRAAIQASAQVIRPYVEAQVAQLEGSDGSVTIDVVASITDRGRVRADDVQARLDGPRSIASWFGPVPMVLAAIAGAVATFGMVVLGAGRARRLAGLVAGIFGGSALLILLLARIVSGRLAAPLAAATGTGDGTWNLPDGLRSVLDDVASNLGGELRSDILRAVLVLGLAAGAAALAGVAIHLDRADRAAWRRRAEDRRRRIGARPALAGGLCIALVVGAGVVVADTVGVTFDDGCNGHVELCDRPYDEVVYAATHNAMASPNIVFVWPEHDGNLTAQLDAGVRALLIDTHYWRHAVSALQLSEATDDSTVRISEEVAQTVLDNAGDRVQARDGTFLCHNECVFGGQPFVDALTEVRTFLDENPREVVTLVIQDAISVPDTVEAFTEAGLDDYLYDQQDRWPTLGELIERNQRLVVFAEFDGGSPDWYAPAYDISEEDVAEDPTLEVQQGAMQETPFNVEDPDAFTCDESRGSSDDPLFLMNHWVSRLTPSRADAAVVNQRDFLVDRARRCESERGLLPNFLAVDFYNLGDVVGAADELNGVD